MDLGLDIQEALQSMTEKLGGWLEALIGMLPNIVAAILILVLFWILGAVARKVVRKVLGRVSSYRAVNRLLSTLSYVAVIAVGLFVALGVLNLDRTVTSLLAGAGILGLAIGFAAQDTMENLLSGIMISLRHPIREGDLIETNDTFGTVQEINLRATLVRTLPGQVAYIPNSQVFKNPLTNYSQSGERRVDVACGVAYGDDLEKAKRVALAAVEDLEARDRSRDAELFYDAFGDSSINFQLRFWIDFHASQTSFLSARSEAIMRIKRAFDDNDITIPFPIRTLDFGVVGGTSMAEELAGVPALSGGGQR